VGWSTLNVEYRNCQLGAKDQDVEDPGLETRRKIRRPGENVDFVDNSQEAHSGRRRPR
jgi:hypothetical protein